MSSTAGAFDRQCGADGEAIVQPNVVVVAAYTAVFLFAGLAALLFVRRLSGAFQQPLGVAAIIFAATVLELAAFGLRQLFRNAALRSSVLSTQYVVLSTKQLQFATTRHLRLRVSFADLAFIPSVIAVMLSLSIHGTPIWGLFLAWLIVVAGETAQRLPRFDLPPDRFRLQPTSLAPSTTPILSEDDPAEPEIPPGLIQQLTRVVEDSRESIHAIVSAPIAANDRLAIVHIAFCPPLAERPELSAHALDSDVAEIRITQVESFGARLEARLPAVSDAPRSVLIEVLGSAKANPSS